MQAKCTKCSKPIALTDIIESNSGLLSHCDCRRPHGLTPEERALFFTFCWDHVVVRCPICEVSFHYTGLAADILGGGARPSAPGVVWTSPKPFALISFAARCCPR